MADFTNQDQEFLETLRKAYEKAASTDASRDPWQELFSRETQVEASRSVLAANAVKGFTGSWAAQFDYGRGINPKDDQAPTPERRTTSKLGQRGFPDVDFVPYNWRTNRFGNKGPSLVGHPISFEVVGPTLKSPACDWVWDLSLGSGSLGGDELVMADRFDAGTPTCTTILQGYNLGDFVLGGPNEPNGGLYLVVSDVGEEGGSMPPFKGASIQEAFVESFPFEVFRIARIEGATIELHPNKSLGTFLSLFDIPAIRAVTILRPYVTRLVAVPNSGPALGREQTYLVVSPEKAASSDLYPPFDGGVANDGTWLQGGFANVGSNVGDADAYGGRNALPVPKPRDEGNGTILQLGVPAPLPVGTWQLEDTSIPSGDLDGKILNIFNVNLDENAPPGIAPRALGWFPVVGNPSPTDVVLQRTVEINPVTGRPFFGPGPAVVFGLDDVNVLCSYTVHDSISTLWVGDFDADAVEASRLTNLIDPRYVQRLEKQASESVQPNPTYAPSGANAGRADRAIFNTRSAPNPSGTDFADDPGNLLDLGFRMVLFPAKNKPDGAVPDFDRPITSRELVIDGSLDPTIKQFVDIDYSAGIVRLSVPPPALDMGVPTASTDVIPNGIPTGPGNKRGEVILYAACVPYSMEGGQLGTGTRTTTEIPDTNRDVDVLSDEMFAYVNPDLTTVSPGIPFFTGSVVLDRELEIPPTGTFQVFAGSFDAPSYGTWRYNTSGLTVTVNNGIERRYTTLNGIQVKTGATPLLPIVGENNSYLVRFLREAPGIQSFGDPSELARSFVNDTTYGASARPSSVRLKNFESRYELDGSITLEEVRQAQRWQQWGTLHPAFYQEVVDDGGLTLVDRVIRTDGVFGEPRRFDELGLTTDEVATISLDLDGNTFEFETSGPGEIRAASFQTPIVSGVNQYRLVIKFSYENESSLGDLVNFIGLLTPLSNPANPASVGLAEPPLLVTDVYVGLRFLGDPSDVNDLWQIVVSNGTGDSSVRSIPRLNPRDPYYLVIESEQDGFFNPDDAVTDPAPYRIRIAVFDRNLDRVAERVLPAGTADIPQSASNVFLGLRNIDQDGDQFLRIYYASFVTRKDLPGPKI